MKKLAISLSSVTAAVILSGPSAQAEEKVDFVETILPVFESRCMECHRAPYEDPRRGRTRRPKGSLRMDTAEEIMKGGDEGLSIVPGKPEESLTYTRLMLPMSDDEHMPPENKDQLTDEEKEAIRLWIEQGADFGDWKESKFDAEFNKIES